MECPICKSSLEKTDYYNKIFKDYNYFCNSCNSYHIINEVNISDYYTKEYHTKFSYNNSFSKIINKLSFVSNRTLGRFNFLFKHGGIKRNSHFLEIGGTFGEFFNIANKKLKPSSYTIIEPDSKFNRSKKNLKFENKLFEDVDINKFKNIDIVQMFHVFEHIFDLSSFLEKIKLIKPVIFYFEVPNCENEGVKIDSLLNNPHYHHFSKKSIEMLFNNHNFNKIILETIEPQSYHPYKKIEFFKRYKLRFTGKNETFDNNGIYLRGIYKI